MTFRLSGLIAAAFSPMRPDGSVALDRAPALVDHALAQGVSGLFVCGSTGEGFSLTSEERRLLVEAYREATQERVPIVVQVGHDSLIEGRALAKHAADVGADAIAAAPPTWFKPADVDSLAECLAVIAEGAPDLPLYYYHIPPLSGVHLPMRELLAIASERLPSLAGIKFSHLAWDDLVQCTSFQDGRYDILYGADESLLSGLAAGVDGAVGSTYNVLGRLSQRVIDSFREGDLDEARRLQAISARLIRVIVGAGGMSALKATMAIAGVDCGPPRLPLRAFDEAAQLSLERALRDAGFFEWSAP